MNIGRLFEGYPSFMHELNSLLPLGYRVEVVDASRVRLFAPHEEPAIIQVDKLKQPKEAQEHQTSRHSADDTRDIPKLGYVELSKMGLSDYVNKVKVGWTALHDTLENSRTDKLPLASFHRQPSCLPTTCRDSSRHPGGHSFRTRRLRGSQGIVWLELRSN